MINRLRLRGVQLLAVLIAVAGLTAVAAPAASAAQTVALTYTVDGLPSQSGIIVIYNPGATVQSGASVTATSGSLTSIAYASNGLQLFTGNDGASVIAQQFLTATGSTITGQATIPTGTTVTVSNSLNSQTTTIKNGQFTIPLTTGVGTSPTSSKPLTVRCRKSGSRCSANVSIAGGASNRPVTIRLPSHRMQLISIAAQPRQSRGAYTISRSRLTGSEYRFVLNAVKANPRGAHLTLTFAN